MFYDIGAGASKSLNTPEPSNQTFRQVFWGKLELILQDSGPPVQEQVWTPLASSQFIYLYYALKVCAVFVKKKYTFWVCSSREGKLVYITDRSVT